MSATPRRLLCLLAGLWLLVSCAGRSQPATGADTRGLSSVYAFEPPPQFPVLQRLGRFTPPATFAPVPGPVNPRGNVYFVTHGWAPGYLDAVQAFLKQGKLPLAWDPNLKNKDGRPYNSGGWFQDVSQSILNTDPGATVFFFSWIDWSATGSFLDPQNAQKNTDMAGQALTSAMQAVLPSGFPPARIHLLGHSYGAKVVTVATVAKRPAHLTLFDSPDRGYIRLVGAANKLYQNPYLPAIPPSRAAGGTFVDNYYSYFGVCYNDRGSKLKPIVDYKLVARICSSLDIGCKHGYPTVFYPQASAAPAKNLGLWWSPLLGDQFKTVQPDYQQTWKNAQGDPLAYQAGSRCFGNSDQIVSGAREARDLLQRHRLDTTEPPVAELRTQDLRFEPLQAEGGARTSERSVTLAEPESAYWHLRFTKEPLDDVIQVDVRFLEPGGDDLLGLWIDGELGRVLSGRWTDREPQTTTINIDHLENGPHVLSIALHSVVADAQAEVEVTNLRKVSFSSGSAGPPPAAQRDVEE